MCSCSPGFIINVFMGVFRSSDCVFNRRVATGRPGCDALLEKSKKTEKLYTGLRYICSKRENVCFKNVKQVME